jgi:hypothetical protein
MPTRILYNNGSVEFLRIIVVVLVVLGSCGARAAESTAQSETGCCVDCPEPGCKFC